MDSPAPTDPIKIRRSRLLEPTDIAQARASRPDASVWVSANAGAGKTHVLKMRVLRLLLSGAEPSRILCLTYTNAAAAEMAQRVFAELATWATLSATGLEATLHQLIGRVPTPEETARARQLFARVIEAPGGLTIKTIHGFCERLLQRFPLEAGLAPGFETLDDQTALALQKAAMSETLIAATRGTDSTLSESLRTAIAFAAEERFVDVMRATLDSRVRSALAEMVAFASAYAAADPGADLIDLYLRAKLNVSKKATPQTIAAQIAALLSNDDLSYAAQVLDGGSTTDRKLAAALTLARKSASERVRNAHLETAFLTKDGAPRSDRYITKAIREAEPGLCQRLDEVRDRLFELKRDLVTVRAITATRAILNLASHIHANYDRHKAHAAALDFDDLIARAAALLSGEGNAAWVLFKLDGGIDHILVDEAQDTSLRQWKIVQALAGEFFAGSDTRDGPRTIFGVGDEKQSIYSFQGAAPKMFAQAGDRLGGQAIASGSEFFRIPLTLSFRTTKPILDAVDQVFADPARTPGVGKPDAQVEHSALRIGEAGCVEVWPLEVAEASEPAPTFDPLADAPPSSPHVRIAQRIARQIRHWLDEKTLLESKGRPIEAGDIMVLLRRRKPLGPILVSELKRLSIPVAGADRLALTDHIAVKDLIAVADFVTLPEDDLTLATLLKSPLFERDDDDLTALAPKRKASLWSALIQAAKTDPRYAEIVETLKRWRAIADRKPPYEFFSQLLDAPAAHRPELTYRQCILRRLGPDATDPLDEFLEHALSFDDTDIPSLQGFAHWMRASAFEIKRDMEHGADQVRIMTAHGAKGLEANIVFLPDTTGDPRRSPSNPFIDLTEAEEDETANADAESDEEPAKIPALFWPVAKSSAVPPVAAAKEVRTNADIAESNRLLYVAMTRARDRLYIAGIAPKTNNKNADKAPSAPPNSWYRLIEEGLDGKLQAAHDPFGNPVARIETPQEIDSPRPTQETGSAAAPPSLPDWARTRVTPEPQRLIPIQPSRLSTLEVDDYGDPLERRGPATPMIETGDGLPAPSSPFDAEPPAPAASTGRQTSGDGVAPGDPNFRFLRGNITHALLQHLPGLEPPQRRSAAQHYVDVQGLGLSPRARQSLVGEVLALLDSPQFADAFGPDSRAEVPLIAEIPSPSGTGPSLKISGQIDRLVITDSAVMVIDFKTNRAAPQMAGEIPEAYLLQLAAYRCALQAIYPGRQVNSALLWTSVPRLMAVTNETLDAYVPKLWAAA